MFFINYDLAKQITEDRRAMAESARRASRRRRAVPEPTSPRTEADVIEVTFTTACEREKIGA